MSSSPATFVVTFTIVARVDVATICGYRYRCYHRLRHQRLSLALSSMLLSLSSLPISSLRRPSAASSVSNGLFITVELSISRCILSFTAMSSCTKTVQNVYVTVLKNCTRPCFHRSVVALATSTMVAYFYFNLASRPLF